MDVNWSVGIQKAKRFKSKSFHFGVGERLRVGISVDKVESRVLNTTEVNYITFKSQQYDSCTC